MAKLTIKHQYKQNPWQITEVFIHDENAAKEGAETIFAFERFLNNYSDTRFHIDLALGATRRDPDAKVAPQSPVTSDKRNPGGSE